MSMTCGIDWAERHHDVALVDEGGSTIAKKRIDTGPQGFTDLVTLIAEHGGDAASVPVAIETDKNLIVVALLAAGFTVYPINPRAVARYRERHGQAGGKSDPGDAAVLAHVLRTDRLHHRPMPVTSESAATVKVLARQHQEAIWARQHAVNRLRSLLADYYPNALHVFSNLTQRTALAVLAAAPSPARAMNLTDTQVRALLRDCGRGDRAGLAERIVAGLNADALRQPAAVEHAYAVTTVGLIAVVAQMAQAISELETALAVEFNRHPQAHLLRPIPGLGPILAARVLGEIGDDPTRFATAAGLRAYAGTAPITRASGRTKTVNARQIRNRRLNDACHWWAFAALTKSPGARAHYDRRRAAGDTHQAALRHLANKLIGRLWWCLLNNQPWDDATAWHNPTEPLHQTAA